MELGSLKTHKESNQRMLTVARPEISKEMERKVREEVREILREEGLL